MEEPMTPTPWRLAVGELFTPERTRWPANSFELRYFDGNFLLQICEPSPSDRATEAFRTGEMHLGLYWENGVIFFLFRIARTWDWSDQAFSVHLVAEQDRGPGEYTEGQYQLLSVVLVDSETGRISALRAVTMSPHFTQTFRKLLERQRADPGFTPAGHNAAIRAVYAKYPKSKELARVALIRERAGGQIA